MVCFLYSLLYSLCIFYFNVSFAHTRLWRIAFDVIISCWFSCHNVSWYKFKLWEVGKNVCRLLNYYELLWACVEWMCNAPFSNWIIKERIYFRLGKYDKYWVECFEYFHRFCCCWVMKIWKSIIWISKTYKNKFVVRIAYGGKKYGHQIFIDIAMNSTIWYW